MKESGIKGREKTGLRPGLDRSKTGLDQVLDSLRIIIQEVLRY